MVNVEVLAMFSLLYEKMQRRLYLQSKTLTEEKFMLCSRIKKKKKKKFGQPKLKAEENGEELKDDNNKIKVEKKIWKKPSDYKEEKKETPKKGEKQQSNPHNEGRRARIIVRNLSFKCNSETLKNIFSKHGNVLEVMIPEKYKGRKLGFGFVQFSSKAEAGMALKALNGTNICDRQVAVDWALPKKIFESKLEEQKEKSDSSTVPEGNNQEEDMETNEDEDGESDGESDDKTNEKQAGNSDSEEESSDEVDESDKDNSTDEDSESDEEDNGENKNAATSKRLSQRPSDVGEGRTLFVRNLPFEAEEEDVVETFSTFGDLNYAKIVIDKESGQSRGSAFIQFKSKEDADRCKDMSEYDRGIVMQGRELSVTLAVTRERATEIVNKEKKKEQKDSRNLFLAREGMIRPGTQAAKDVPQADMTRRLKFDSMKRRKLRDQNMFVSSVRLCVHNIPATLTDKQLRKIVMEASNNKQAQLTECRIMRDLARTNAQGVAKSQGFAFCTFSQHEDALNALKTLNNNPDTFTANKRPIVEFSIENRSALEAKQRRQERSRVKQLQKNKEDAEAASQTNKRKRKRNKQMKESRPLENRAKESKVAREMHKGPLGLPSHSGPKVRHKARGTEKPIKAKKKNFGDNRKPGFNRNKEVKQHEVKAVKNLQKKRKDIDGFDKLVASYKKSILKSAKF